MMRFLLCALCSLAWAIAFGPPALAQDDDENGKPTHTVLGIPTHPYGALTVTRPFNVDDVSVGFKVGVEADVSPLFVSAQVHLRDILTEGESEIFPWDGELEIALGAYW